MIKVWLEQLGAGIHSIVVDGYSWDEMPNGTLIVYNSDRKKLAAFRGWTRVEKVSPPSSAAEA